MENNIAGEEINQRKDDENAEKAIYLHEPRSDFQITRCEDVCAESDCTNCNCSGINPEILAVAAYLLAVFTANK